MTATDPIVPLPKQVDQWFDDAVRLNGITKYYIATQAAQWGADQELEACCEWIPIYTPWDENNLRAARRPKPPSLKEQALAVLDDCSDRLDSAHENTIRRALEALPE